MVTDITPMDIQSLSPLAYNVLVSLTCSIRYRSTGEGIGDTRPMDHGRDVWPMEG